MRLAAIDIGSNAARLLIIDVINTPDGKKDFIKLNLVRVPLRLGFDVFEKGEISKSKVKKVVETIKAYRHLINIYDVKHIIAAATSAMRDAKNADDILRRVKLETDIDIEIITGDKEASLIYENHVAENMDKDHSYLYIDVGGGSTEMTFFAEGKMIFKESFNIGTIRLLKNQVEDSQWQEMKDYVKLATKDYKKVIAIGSGGNINKVFSLSKRKEGKPLSWESLRDFHKEFSNFTIAERMHYYKLREDRADVIVPALLIYINVMRWAGADEIYVPKIGLADGLIHKLYEEVKLQDVEV
ncbi:MAG: exopolyphosphatase [Sphingobacteriales bacterium]